MPRTRVTYDWDGIAAAYAENNETLQELSARFGASTSAISQRAKRENWPSRKPAAEKRRHPGPTFEWRLARALDRQITELEERWAGGEAGLDAALAEKEARTLSVLIRTAEKLKEIEAMTKPKKTREGQTERDDRLDRKRLRETLERRLDQLIATAHAHGVSGEPEGKGT